MSSNIRITKVCNFCSQEFIAKTTVTKYCSHKCASRAYKKKKRAEKIGSVSALGHISSNDRIENNLIAKTIDSTRAEKSIIRSISEMEFLTVKQTCTLLNMSKPTLYKMFNEGRLPKHKIGGKVLVKRQDINLLFT